MIHSDLDPAIPAGQHKRLLAGVLLLVLMALAWRVLSMGMAEIYARKAPARALWWRADHPVALLLEAERQSAPEGDRQQARQLAKAALRANPLDGRGYRVLGRLAQMEGKEQSALRFYELAAKHSPRDLPTQAWLFEHHLRLGHFKTAVAHADRMLRVQPELAARLDPLLQKLAQEPLAQAALAEVLRASPPWREKFLGMLCQQVANGQRIAGLMAALPTLSGSEQSAWLERLISDRAWSEAYLAWASRLPATTVALPNVFNGGFESPASGQGFDWRFSHAPGASIELLADTRISGRQAMSVGFEGQRVAFEHVRQLLALPPGRYRLEGYERAQELQALRGLVWSVNCAENAMTLAMTDPLKGDGGWRKFSVGFEVPVATCGGQWLQLSLVARTDTEQMVAGRAWFDDLSITRLP